MTNFKKSLLSATLLGLAVLGMAVRGQAQVTPSQDAYTNSVSPTLNFGTSATLGVVNSAASIQSAFIQFDLSSIPAGYTSSNIAKATLKLYVNSVTTAGSFNVDFVNGSWTEETITGNVAPALGSTLLSSVPLTGANVHDYVLLDVTPAVGDWLNGTQPNDGIALVANSPLSVTFDSKENVGQSHPAELDIVFSGGVGTVTSVGTGAGLTGGPSTSSGTLSVATGGVTNTMLLHPSIRVTANAPLTGGGVVALGGTASVGLQSCAANQILQIVSGIWTCANLSGGGTITGVTAGTDLTGGGTSGTVTINLNTAALQAANDTRYAQLGAADTFSRPIIISTAGGTAIQATGANFGVRGSSSLPGAGIYGNTTLSGVNVFGVEGESTNATAVQGIEHGSGSGVVGDSITGTGVYGYSNKGTGIFGATSATGGSVNGVQGQSFNATAVRGDDGGGGSGVVGTSVSARGVVGSGTSAGVYGITTATGGSVNGVQGASTNATAVRGDDGGGGSGVVGTSVGGTGIYGITAATGGSANGVQGASTNATAVRGDDAGGGSGVVGTSASGIGVYGAASNGGFGFVTPSNVQQARGMGGWVKAMAVVDPLAQGGIAIIRCYNSQASGTTIWTPPCGISITHLGLGDNLFDFGFQVNDRFLLLTNLYADPTIHYVFCFSCTTVNQSEIHSYNTHLDASSDDAFSIFVF